MAFQINTHDFMYNHISEWLFYQIRKIKGSVKYQRVYKIRKYRTRHEL